MFSVFDKSGFQNPIFLCDIIQKVAFVLKVRFIALPPPLPALSQLFVKICRFSGIFLCLEQIVNETLPALQKLKQAGKIRFIGITGLPLGIFTYVLDRVPPGTVDVILSYCHYSINDSSLEDLLPYLKSKGVGVISASPLAMGLLTEAGAPEWHPASSELKVNYSFFT